jgi:flagellar FliL protein
MPAHSSSDNDKGGSASARFSLKKTVVELSLVALIAAGGGALLATLDPPPATSLEKPAGNATTAAGSAKEAGCAAGAANILDLPPVVTNLGAPTDAFIRVEASIVFDGKATPHPEILAAEIATDELAYLRTLTLSEIQGPIGLASLRQDLSDRAVTRSGGKISEFILRTLVVQ